MQMKVPNQARKYTVGASRWDMYVACRWRESEHAVTHTSDPYRTLQVIPEAEPEVIQAAYRALARQHHPDHGGSEEQMALLNEAWAILREPHLRANYDRTRRAAAAVQTAREAPQPIVAQAPAATPVTPARPASGSVLDFGRYAGHSLGELAASDPDYLLWLSRTPIGRKYQAEIESLVARSSVATATRSRVRSTRTFRRR